MSSWSAKVVDPEVSVLASDLDRVDWPIEDMVKAFKTRQYWEKFALLRNLMIPRTRDDFDADQQSSRLLLYSDCCSVDAGGSRNKKHNEK